MQCVYEVEESGRVFFLYRKEHNVIYGQDICIQHFGLCLHSRNGYVLCAETGYYLLHCEEISFLS